MRAADAARYSPGGEEEFIERRRSSPRERSYSPSPSPPPSPPSAAELKATKAKVAAAASARFSGGAPSRNLSFGSLHRWANPRNKEKNATKGATALLNPKTLKPLPSAAELKATKAKVAAAAHALLQRCAHAARISAAVSCHIIGPTQRNGNEKYKKLMHAGKAA